MEAVKKEGEICGGFRREPVVLEPHVIGQRIGWRPTVAERRIGDHGIETGHLRRVGFAQHLPIVRQRITVENLELGIFHPMQQHVHAREVVSRDVLFLTVDLADAMRPHTVTDVEQQRARAAGEIH